MAPTKPTARERAQRILYGERGKPTYEGDPVRQLIHDGLEDAIAAEVESAAQAAREEARAPMECGHRRTNYDPGLNCLACVREEQAVRQARAEERATGPCGKHPMACYSRTPGPEEWGTGNIVCEACTREARVAEAVQAARDEERALVLDKPEDRLWHDEDGTWWRRDEDGHLKATDPPAKLLAIEARAVEEAVAAERRRILAGIDAIERGERSGEGERGE